MRLEVKDSNPEASGQGRRFLGPVLEHEPSEPPSGNGTMPAASGESLIHAEHLPPGEVAISGGLEEESESCDSLEEHWQEVPLPRRHRKRRLAAAFAARAVIIWGFKPARQSLLGLAMELKRRGVVYETMRRGGAGTHHYVELAFVSSVHRKPSLVD